MIVTATDEDTALAVNVVPGQSHDAPLCEPMIDRTAKRLPAIDEVVGDKGFDSNPLRQRLLDRGTMPQIPSRCNRVDPYEVLPESYRERNRVERLFAKLKQFRRAATRYEKLKETFLGVLHLALGFIRLRKITIVNTA